MMVWMLVCPIKKFCLWITIVNDNIFWLPVVIIDGRNVSLSITFD